MIVILEEELLGHMIAVIVDNEEAMVPLNLGLCF
jgi:hypothetical protein